MRNKKLIKKVTDQFKTSMDTKIFQLQVTVEIQKSMLWWSIFQPKRLLYFMHLHEVSGMAVRPAHQIAKTTTRKNIIQLLKDFGYNNSSNEL